MAKFVKIPIDMLDDESLTMKELKAYVAICSYLEGNNGESFPSLKELMLICSVSSKGNMSRVVKSLVNKGYIERGERHSVNGAQISNVYTIKFGGNQND